jgi:hypothetical protein
MAKVSQRQIVAQVDGWPPKNTKKRVYFAQVSGGEVQASVEKVFDGGSRYPEVLSGPFEIGDLTVTRHYDPVTDGPLLRQYRPLVGKARFDVTVYTLNQDLVDPASARIYPQALLVNISEPEGDSSSGAPASFSLTFACGLMTSGSTFPIA